MNHITISDRTAELLRQIETSGDDPQRLARVLLDHSADFRRFLEETGRSGDPDARRLLDALQVLESSRTPPAGETSVRWQTTLPSPINLTLILHRSLQLFDRDEYRILCLALGVPYENIVTPQGTIADAAGRLMAFCERRGLTPALIQIVVSERVGHALVEGLQQEHFKQTVGSARSDRSAGPGATRERDRDQSEGAAAVYHSCFMSYTTADTTFASRLHDDLRSAGVDCFFAPNNIQIGAVIRAALDDALGRYDKLLVILSTASVQSTWVQKEVETALERERRTRTTILFPINIDAKLDYDRATSWVKDIRLMRHVGDFREWRDPAAYASSLSTLLNDLRI